MAWHLFRLGRWSFRMRRAVAGLWLLLLVVIGVSATVLAGETDDAFELSGIESTEAFDLIEERLPGSAPDGATARIVVEAPEGRTLADADQRAALDRAAQNAATAGTVQVAGPFDVGALTEDARVGYLSIDYSVSAADLGEADRDGIEQARATLEAAGMRVDVGGDVIAVDLHAATAEAIGIGIAIVVLALTLGSLIAAGMPLATALIGVGVGVASISALSGIVELTSTTSALATMLGLAVGIDYALFIMARYQAEVRAGRSLEEAAGRAVGTAGSAVVFAGLTVIIALVGLSICGIGFLTQMGIGGAFTVAIAVLIALTLLPALLGFAGERALGGRTRRARAGTAQPDETDETSETAEPAAVRVHLGRRWVEAVVRWRWPALVGGVAVAAIASIPVLSLQLSLPDDTTKPADSEVRVAYERIAEAFGPGANGPLLIAVDTAEAPDPDGALATATERLEDMAAEPGSDIAAVIPAAPDQPGAAGLATLTVIPLSGPTDERTKQLVGEIRAALADLPAAHDARALVSGVTAVGIDISDELRSVFPLYLGAVVMLAFLLLIAVFRSVWVPLKAALGFLLSVGVALGATVAVFQWGWLSGLIGLDSEGPVLFLLPILLTGILFGLAMDYEVFLVTRMREAHVHGASARDAVVEGFAHSARVVAAAAVIMVGVFGGFAFSDDIILKTIGFALAIGVLVDAFVVRMLIVPAVMAIVGERIWWMPRALERRVPVLDVEGEALERRLADAPGDADDAALSVPAGRIESWTSST